MGVEGNRLLRKLIPATHVINDGETPYTYQFGPGMGGGGWEIVNNGTVRAMLVWRGYFDLAGYVKQDATTFVLGVNFQESNTHLAGGLEPTGAIHNWRMCTKRAVNDNDLSASNFTTAFTMFSPPGMMSSTFDLEEIFSGRYRQLTPDTTVNTLLVQTNAQSWGAGDATAGDRLHVTLIYLLANLTNPEPPASSLLIAPDQAVVIPVLVTKEKDLVYIERLRRSYVLAESVD